MPKSESSYDSTVRSFLDRASYRNQDLCKRDILAALHHYKGLQPKLEKYVFNDGRSRDLICLDGTIPVPYHSATYNIPVIIWVLDTHPSHAPLCYVRPTADMQIKVSENVDRNGKVYLPYLHEWSSSNADILGLIQICIITFSDSPPVFARRQQPPPVPNPPQMPQRMYGQAQPHQMPYPPVQGGTPYPPAANNPYPPPPGGVAYPPPPAYPPNNVNQAHTTPYPPTPAYPPAGPTSGYPPYPQGPIQSQQNESNTGTITQEHIKASLRSAVEDKVRRALADEYQAKQGEVTSLCKIRDELKDGQNRLQSAITQLDKETNELTGLCGSLKTEQELLMKALEKLESDANEEDDDWCSKKGTSGRVDEAIHPVAPLHKQLVNAYAEESALADAIYYLGEGLRRGILDCDIFLKHVRNLSRKQFFLRATMQKAREKAGLPV